MGPRFAEVRRRDVVRGFGVGALAALVTPAWLRAAARAYATDGPPGRGRTTCPFSITAADFPAFVFENPVVLWAGVNPQFFDGTAVEQAAREEIRRAGWHGARGTR